MLPVGGVADKCEMPGAPRTNRAPMACWLQPTRLAMAAAKRPPATASQDATHCHAAAAMSPSPRIRFGLRRGPDQSRHAAISGASVRGLSPMPSHRSCSGEPAGSSVAHGPRRLRPRLDRGIGVNVGDPSNSTPSGEGGIKAQAHRAGPAADDGPMIQVPQRVRPQPVGFLGPDDQAGIHAFFLQPFHAQRQPLQE